MTTLEICRACPGGHYAARPEDDPAVMGGCALLLCKGCGDRDVPDRAAWRMVVGGTRPCPQGHLAGAEPVRLAAPTPANGDWVAARAGTCLACPGEQFEFRGAANWHCEAEGGPINPRLRDPAAACRLGYWLALPVIAAGAEAEIRGADEAGSTGD